MTEQDYAQKIADFLGCECEFFKNIKDDAQLIEKFNTYTEEGKKDGFIPLIIVPSNILLEAFELALEDAGLENSPAGYAALRASILERAGQIDAEAFLSVKLAEYTQMHGDDNIIGDFKQCETSHCFYSYYEDNHPAPALILAKIPVQNPWEAAAWLPMGGFNDCPSPEEQVAVFHYWYDKYGAVPAVLTYDNWEMEAHNPPRGLPEAEILAREQFAFCYDRVMQGANDMANIRSLASELVNSTTWYFWWD